jgi:hypothetical protein
MKINMNMNDIVHVEFTSYGKSIFERKLQDLNIQEKVIKPMLNCRDFELHELFYYFGDVTVNGNKDVFVNNEITFL